MDKTELSCRLCRNVINEANLSTEGNIREVLEFLLKNFDEDKVPEVCKTCSTKLYAAYSFKETCLKTEDSISPYIGSELVDVDMKEIFFLKNSHEQANWSEHENVCRLCMQLLTCEFIPLSEVDVGLIRDYIPEVNFSATKDPLICQVCFKSLIVHSGFLRTCLDVDDGLKYSGDDKGSIKTEEVDIKFEENDTNSDFNNSTSIVKPETCTKPEPPSEQQTYKCDTCPFETKYKCYLRLHKLRHKHPSELEMHKCDKCSYQTKLRRYLLSHMLRHKDPAQLKKYKCDACQFETRHKSYLTTHQLMHKNPEEVRMYRCDKCKYETYLKNQIVAHQLCHKDSSEVEMYRCGKCDYETKWKYNLAHHELRHKDPSELPVYKCDKCDYETNKKYSFKYHRMLHRDPAQLFKCDVCGYKSKYQRWFVKHQAMHEAEMQGAQ